jgi:hypothetical protein
VGLVQNENLESVTRRRKDCAFAQVTGIVNTVVRSRVDFNHI